jgi:hypothetical protein
MTGRDLSFEDESPMPGVQQPEEAYASSGFE